ncbi:hypothetical protein [Bradyrhizobium yuanmingense]|uniref:hypothetical protein n=1 Tax=Bradyrhizobium yuanmingense TaxID=108015 RepID=UPI0035172297
MDTERIYFQVRNLLDTLPDFYNLPGHDADQATWLARASVLVEQGGRPADAIAFVTAMDTIIGNTNISMHGMAVEKVRSILFRTLARLEATLPAGLQGSYIAAGNPFDALAAVARVFQSAKNSLLIVDPYADEKLLRDFLPLAPEHVQLQILSDAYYVKPSLKPAVERWTKQFSTRPLAARLTPPRLLHDRLIVVDDQQVWIVTQSFKDLAERAPASIARFEAEPATLKLESYRQMWSSANPI